MARVNCERFHSSHAAFPGSSDFHLVKLHLLLSLLAYTWYTVYAIFVSNDHAMDGGAKSWSSNEGGGGRSEGAEDGYAVRRLGLWHGLMTASTVLRYGTTEPIHHHVSAAWSGMLVLDEDDVRLSCPPLRPWSSDYIVQYFRPTD
jgi:hypothetical protein